MTKWMILEKSTVSWSSLKLSNKTKQTRQPRGTNKTNDTNEAPKNAPFHESQAGLESVLVALVLIILLAQRHDESLKVRLGGQITDNDMDGKRSRIVSNKNQAP